jgi:hypothetical protein
LKPGARSYNKPDLTCLYDGGAKEAEAEAGVVATTAAPAKVKGPKVTDLNKLTSTGRLERHPRNGR